MMTCWSYITNSMLQVAQDTLWTALHDLSDKIPSNATPLIIMKAACMCMFMHACIC